LEILTEENGSDKKWPTITLALKINGKNAGSQKNPSRPNSISPSPNFMP
jgi:hypothetical protein